MRIYLKNNPAKFHPGPVGNNGALSPVRTGEYTLGRFDSRRFRRQSPFSATVAESTDCLIDQFIRNFSDPFYHACLSPKYSLCEFW